MHKTVSLGTKGRIRWHKGPNQVAQRAGSVAIMTFSCGRPWLPSREVALNGSYLLSPNEETSKRSVSHLINYRCTATIGWHKGPNLLAQRAGSGGAKGRIWWRKGPNQIYCFRSLPWTVTCLLIPACSAMQYVYPTPDKRHTWQWRASMSSATR